MYILIYASDIMLYVLLGFYFFHILFFQHYFYLFIFCCTGSSLQCSGFSLRWLLLLRSTGSRCADFSSCNMWAWQLWCMDLVAPQHVRSSWTRDRTHVPCCKADFKHWTTREAQQFLRSIHMSTSRLFLPIAQCLSCISCFSLVLSLSDGYPNCVSFPTNTDNAMVKILVQSPYGSV